MVRAAILRAIAGHTGDHEIVPRPALPHQSNRLYDVWIDGQHVIAKEYLRADRQGAPQHEYAALQRLEHLDLAPKPVFFDPA
jgi:hypothetical protein